MLSMLLILRPQSPNNLLVEGNYFEGNSAGNAGGGAAVIGAGEAGGNNASVTGNIFLGNQVQRILCQERMGRARVYRMHTWPSAGRSLV